MSYANNAYDMELIKMRGITGYRMVSCGITGTSWGIMGTHR